MAYEVFVDTFLPREHPRFAPSSTVGSATAMRERIKEEIRRKRDPIDGDMVSRAMVSAINNYRNEPAFFNLRYLHMDLVQGQWIYYMEPAANDLPRELVSIETVQYQTQDGYSYPLDAKTYRQIEKIRNHEDSTGRPTMYAFRGDSLLVYPAPDDNTPVEGGDGDGDPDPVEGNGGFLVLTVQMHSGIPYYSWDGTEWKFYDDTGGLWSSSYLSEWFGLGEELIRNRAKKDIFLSVLDDPEAAAMAEKMEMDALRRLRDRSLITGLRRPTPWPSNE